MSIVAIANQKGGVGKTTTTINLAASLGVAEQKVLVVDMDPQANTSSGIGILEGTQDIEKNVYAALMGDIPAAEAIVSSATPNVDVLPASADLAGFEVEAVNTEDREYQLAKLLQPYENQYDVIIIDCPPSLSLLTLNALACAQHVLVPLQAEYYAMEGLSRLIQTIDLVRENVNPQLKLSGIVLTMFDKRNRLSHQVAAELKTHFSADVLWETQIPRNVRLSEAPSFGKPVIEYDITSVGAQSYLALAKEFIQRLMRPATPVAGKGQSPSATTSLPGANA